MPPLPPAAAIVKVRLVGNLQGTLPWNNIIHTRYTGVAPTSAQLLALGTAIASLWGTNLAPLSAAENNLTEIQLADLSAPTSATATAFTPVAGTRVGTSFMAQVCMVGSWLSQTRWRGGHFRNYFPFGVTNDRANVFQWNGAFITAATNGLTAFLAGWNALTLAGAPIVMVGLSRRTGHANRPAPQPFNITGVVVHPRVDTQRRRLGKERV